MILIGLDKVAKLFSDHFSPRTVPTPVGVEAGGATRPAVFSLIIPRDADIRNLTTDAFPRLVILVPYGIVWVTASGRPALELVALVNALPVPIHVHQTFIRNVTLLQVQLKKK